MTARTVELTADQLTAIGTFAGNPELTNLVADPDHAERPGFAGCFHGASGGPELTWQGRKGGIAGTVDGREVRVTDAELVAWVRALPGGHRGETDRTKAMRIVRLFTQTRCAAPADLRPGPMLPQDARALHVCGVPAIYRDETVREMITRSGVHEYGLDFPYPCRWCRRVNFHRKWADHPEVDALADRFRSLGVLLDDY
ncbi:hypothetical protein ACXYTP_23495 [Tsukamurella ocularis]